MIFTGEYQHSIDTQHRLAIPADVRNRMERDKVEPCFVLMLGDNSSIQVWPEDTFNAMSHALTDPFRSFTTPAPIRAAKGAIFPGSRHVTLDSAGRMKIDEGLLADSGLDANVVLLGMGDYMEIRDPEQWAQDKAYMQRNRRDIMASAHDMVTQVHNNAAQDGANNIAGVDS